MGQTMTTSPPPSTPHESPVAPAGRSSGLSLAGKILGWILLVLAGLVVLGLLAVTIGPRFLPYQALIVRSGSMSPTIPTGSIVFYRKIDAAKVKVGDIIVFDKPGSTNEKVTHRVFRIGQSPTGRYAITKGDANGVPDDWRVPLAGTGWVSVFHLPSVGYALVYLQSTLARLLLLVVPAILLGAITLYEIWHDRTRGVSA
jgi:signal peptidase